VTDSMPAASSISCSPDRCSKQSTGHGSGRCPVSGAVSLNVDLVTLKAMLTSSALRRLDGRAYRFCPDSECEVVYFDREAGSVFRKSDVLVRIGRKETTDPIPVCYCFDISEADLRREIERYGKTDIPAMITAEVRAGHCACEVRNPQGTCCLGIVSKAAKRIQAEVATSAAEMRVVHR